MVLYWKISSSFVEKIFIEKKGKIIDKNYLKVLNLYEKYNFMRLTIPVDVIK